jgi:hypothetical protein
MKNRSILCELEYVSSLSAVGKMVRTQKGAWIGKTLFLGELT